MDEGLFDRLVRAGFEARGLVVSLEVGLDDTIPLIGAVKRLAAGLDVGLPAGMEEGSDVTVQIGIIVGDFGACTFVGKLVDFLVGRRRTGGPGPTEATLTKSGELVIMHILTPWIW